MADHAALYREECDDIASFLADLPDEEWDRPSLCSEWTVREVVGHMLLAWETGVGGMLGGMARSGFNPNRFAINGARKRGAAPVGDLRKAFENRNHSGGFQKVFGAKVMLMDRLVHHQDIRRAVDRPREVPSDRLTAVLEQALKSSAGTGSAKRARGLRLAPTDLGGTYGDGPEIVGSGEAILMAVCGRGDAAADLSGDGVETLKSRL